MDISRRASNLFSNTSDLSGYSDIIVDVSALPMPIYLPVLGKILSMIDAQRRTVNSQKTPNLHIIVAENVYLDSIIIREEIEEDASYLFGFTSDLSVMSQSVVDDSLKQVPRLWIPIIGEDKIIQLQRISILARPTEICPILPSPSHDPRRSDNLVREYREIFSWLPVEIKNIVYGSEQNPFEVYREISETIDRYMEALKSLGGCKVVISPLSSKLLSISSFLVAYERKERSVGISYVAAGRYELREDIAAGLINRDTELFSLWIAGDCYNV